MKSRLARIGPALAAVGLAALTTVPTAAQYERRTGLGINQLPWENNRFRVSRVTVEPGASYSAAGADRILVYLTADADGRLAADAVWRPAADGDLPNRASTRLEALAIEVKPVEPGRASGTPPEAIYRDTEHARVSPLIDNARVLVTRHRYAGNAYGGALHFHPDDALVIYLRGGAAWHPLGEWGWHRVRRGDVDVVPANTFHALGNAGPDPLELLVIVPR